MPHITGFRMLMAMLTHRSWPLPIWGALQVRNRLSMHSPLEAGDTGDLIGRVAGWRVLEKGIEVDLQSQLQQRNGCTWESVITFYYRGRFGSPMEHGAALGAPPVSLVLGDHCAYTAPWRVDGHDRWRFGALTGDYNGIHQWDWYARRFGFAAAFAHPQRVAAQCLAHLHPSDSIPQTLDLWIKGPVYFGSEVVQTLSALANDGGQDFALSISNDCRPALVGRLHNAP